MASTVSRPLHPSRTAAALSRLTLTDFRNYAALTWHPPGRRVVVTGPNGSGKTNLLEAISLLAPGRGLRNTRLADLPRRGEATSGGWAVHARLDDGAAERELATGQPAPSATAPATERRTFRLDGAAPRTQADIAAAFACIWLTPQMDRLFQDGASGRRRFLDRLVYALEPGHAREVAACEHATSGRNRLLARGNADPAWLAGLEDAMARHGLAATAARASLVIRLNAALAGGAAGGFPAARLVLVDALATRLETAPALAVEDWLRTALAAARPADAATGSAALGAHRADMQMEDADTGLPASLASTGQQKALLIGTILGHAALIATARGAAPMLLLDEPAVHLDAARRSALWHALAASPAQTILTGTDPEAFAGLDATFLRTGGGGLST